MILHLLNELELLEYLHSPRTHRVFLQCKFVGVLTVMVENQLLEYLNQIRQAYSTWGLHIL